MKINKLITAGIIMAVASALALDYVEVIDVKARQRYPWNGLVDIDFELDSKATEPYMMNVTVFDNVGKTNLPVKTVYTEKVSQKANPCMVTKDTTRIVWDAAADLPDGFKCTNVLVTCQDTRCVPVDKLYMVINLSDGAVSYLDSVPSGGWTDEYKTTKMVLRRIEKGSFMMGSEDSELGRLSNEDRHKVTLTKPFYIGVFEVTEHQWGIVCEEEGTSKKAKFVAYGAIRGADCTGDGYQGTFKKTAYCYPDSTTIDSDSFVGKLIAKTSLSGFDLPTEAQWEYACKAGCDVGVNIGCECTQANVDLAARNKNNANDGRGDASCKGVTHVGCYMPNAWGLYDMLGNISEFCRDAYVDHLGANDQIDPVGPEASIYEDSLRLYPGSLSTRYDLIKRVVKGGAYRQTTFSSWDYHSWYTLEYSLCRSSHRGYMSNEGTQYGGFVGGMCGFRVALTIEE